LDGTGTEDGGDDILYGGDGDDWILGEAGSDFLFGDEGSVYRRAA